MSQPFYPQQPHMRISDDERSDAMSALGRALAEGRLSMPEYEDRISAVCEAHTRQELAPLFSDIPYNPAAGSHTEVAVYTANEVAETRRRGQKTRAGLFGLTHIGAFGLMFGGLAAGMGGFSVAALLLIPTVFILLYIMKVGPDSWYVPSPQQLERQRFREIQSAQATEMAQRRAMRRQQADQLTSDAMTIAQRALNNFKDNHKK